MIEIKNLTKIYKLSKKQQKEHKTKDTQKKAVDDLSLTVDRGEIFGLLGTNGAGKTTTLRCLATLLKPTSGSISIDGLDVCRDSEKVRAKISFLTNEIKMDPYFTPDYLFSFFGRLRGMDNSLVEARKKELFEYFGITDFKNKKVEELSTGMKQKVSIAVSLVHDPEIILLYPLQNRPPVYFRQIGSADQNRFIGDQKDLVQRLESCRIQQINKVTVF